LRGGIFAIGVAILLIGFFFAYQGYSILNEYEKYGIWGSLAAAVSEDVRQAINQARNMFFFGCVLGIVGFFTTVYGAVTKPKCHVKFLTLHSYSSAGNVFIPLWNREWLNHFLYSCSLSFSHPGNFLRWLTNSLFRFCMHLSTLPLS